VKEVMDNDTDDIAAAFDEFFETAFDRVDAGKLPLERLRKFFPKEVTDR